MARDRRVRHHEIPVGAAYAGRMFLLTFQLR